MMLEHAMQKRDLYRQSAASLVMTGFALDSQWDMRKTFNIKMI